MGNGTVKILVLGDIVGRPGRNAVFENLDKIKKLYSPDFIIINAENAAGGFGITPDIANDFFKAGIDLITTGNHVWRQKDIKSYLDNEKRIIRPLNYPPGIPGKGTSIIQKNGFKIAAINLLGRIFMDPVDCPFRSAEKEIKKLTVQTKVIVVDFHAEATSEKVAMGRHLEGKASFVFGTHTHIQTADECVLPGGTAYITDIGMTGPIDSVIGMEKKKVLQRFLTGMPHKFDVAHGKAKIEGAIAEIHYETGRATEIKRIQLQAE